MSSESEQNIERIKFETALLIFAITVFSFFSYAGRNSNRLYMFAMEAIMEYKKELNYFIETRIL